MNLEPMSEAWRRRATQKRDREGTERIFMVEEVAIVFGKQRTPQACKEIAESEYGPAYDPGAQHG